MLLSMASKRTTILILGYGEIGSAIGKTLAQNAKNIIIPWDKNVDKVPGQPPLETAISQADVIFLCVPTWILGNAIQSIVGTFKPGTILVTVAKGFEKESCRTVPEVIAQSNGLHPHVHLGGPMLAEELQAGKPSAALAASTNAKARRTIASLFNATSLKVETSQDFIGVSMAGALKNVYAIGMGILDGLELGANARGWYLAKALEEMRLITEAFGGKAKSTVGLAGLGDLVATGTSEHSSNYAVGRELARGEAPSKSSEGLNTFPCLFKRLPELTSTLPLLKAIDDIVNRHSLPRESFNQAFLIKKSTR